MRDVAVIGGGIVGTAAAAYLAEAGASVVLFEATEIGAGASGRNSGAIQHPIDSLFGRLHVETLPLYRELSEGDPDFNLANQPDGLLMVTTDPAAAKLAVAGLQAEAPELDPIYIDPSEMRRLEPGMADGVAGCLLQTGYAVVPAAATLAFARRAARAGVEMRIGAAASLPDARAAAGAVLVAAGPWSVEIVPGWADRPPISRRWGVVATIALAQPPRRILEELTIDVTGGAEDVAFSLMTAAGASSLGSTFLSYRPEVETFIARLLEHGRRFVPAVEGATVTGRRLCARPASFDGRPLIGPVPGEDGLFVCAGHGPWGISTGPASARLVADAILGRSGREIPPGLEAGRF